jgi:predicted transcriptional regulator
MIYLNMTRWLLATFFFFCFFSTLSFAATLSDISVEKKGDRYILHIKAKVDANSNRIKRIVTDYNNLKSINPYLKESEVVSKSENNRATVSMLTKACVLFICYKIRHVQDFQRQGNDIIYGRIIPKKSDFKQGWSRWTITADDSNNQKEVTQLVFDSEMTPDFFILPIIGTYHIKKKILEIAMITINKLEKKAQ